MALFTISSLLMLTLLKTLRSISISDTSDPISDPVFIITPNTEKKKIWGNLFQTTLSKVQH